MSAFTVCGQFADFWYFPSKLNSLLFQLIALPQTRQSFEQELQ
jgi:hypothetical protein